MSAPLKKFIKTLLFHGSSMKFAMAVILGLGFSMSVILSTIGIMDGFEFTLKTGLRKAVGDLYIYSRDGFFDFEKSLKMTFEDFSIQNHTPLIQSEGFALHENKSKGIIIRGIEPVSFQNVTGMEVNFEGDGVVLGKELANYLRVKKGDNVVLSIIGENASSTGLPELNSYLVEGIVEHGVYQKDLRYIYMNISYLQEYFNSPNKINSVLVKADTDLNDLTTNLDNQIGHDFRVSPFWSDFSTLFEAVKVEKVMIALVLQTIVVIAIFNVLAYIFFLNERRSREIFLFKAMGMSKGLLARGWCFFIGLIWSFSCLISIAFVYLFKFILEETDLFFIPGDVYYLSKLKLIIDSYDYFLVFGSSLVWLSLISIFALKKINKQSIIHGLRKEFA